jgi:hypothetical protein
MGVAIRSLDDPNVFKAEQHVYGKRDGLATMASGTMSDDACADLQPPSALASDARSSTRCLVQYHDPD